MAHNNLTFAQIRNRAEQSQLIAELQRIEKEKKNELRMYDTEQQRFKTKYSKLNLASANLLRKDVHSLVFTRDEVDIEKIICLHMISAHRTETLTPPRRRFKYMCKEHSPSERLLDRSKRGYHNNERLTSLLPFYTIELMEFGAMGEKFLPPVINDGRLAARILVNIKLRELIGTVIRALDKSNKEKLKQLSSMANDITIIKEILTKRNIQSFMDKIKDMPLITSCESYVLTPPFKIKTRDLNIRTLSGHVEDLIKHIRQNVLQYPKRRLIKLSPENQSKIKKKYHLLQNSASASIRPRRIEMDNISKSSKSSRESAINTARRSVEDDRKSLGITNHIAKNIRNASKVKKIKYEDTEFLDSDVIRRGSTSSRRSSKRKSVDAPLTVNITSDIVSEIPSSETTKIQLKNMEEVPAISETNEDVHQDRSCDKLPKKKLNCTESDKKSYIKQTTCPACMQRWKTPLPSPKTPRVKTSSVVPTPLLKTNSMNRISMMINKEMYKLESYDRKYAPENKSSRKCKVEKRIVTDSFDSINLSPMDLAKIEQEIKEKETKRKLEKFLNEDK